MVTVVVENREWKIGKQPCPLAGDVPSASYLFASGRCTFPFQINCRSPGERVSGFC